MDPDQLEYFIIEPADHINDLDDEWEMGDTSESTRNIFDVLNDEEVELIVVCIYILLKESYQ